MNNPIIIDLSKTGTKEYWSFSADQDVIFIGADTVRTQKLQVDGGHNIVVLGGEYEPAGKTSNGTIAILGVTGNIWIDGVKINNVNNTSDAIDVGGATGYTPNVYLQNIIATNVHGAKSGSHADIVQTQGPVGQINIHNLTGDTNYQGLFIAPQHTTLGATLSNINLSYNSSTSDDGSATTYLLWTLDSMSETPFPITFENVYVEPRSGQNPLAATVWPKTGMGGATIDGKEITWTGLPYSGHVTVGTPSTDFVSESEVGLNFADIGTLLNSIGLDGSQYGGTPAPVPGDDGAYVFPIAAESGAITKWLKAGETGSLTGTDGNDQLAGRSNDVADTLIGGKGDDTYIVGMTADQVVEKAGEGIDTVLSYAKTYTLSDNVENLIMSTNAVTGIGNSLANRITGNADANIIDGKGGGDYLTGGGGADTFVIGKGYGYEIISDFKAAASAGSVVDLQGFSFTSFDEIKAKMVQQGTSVVLDLGNGDAIMFKNATIAQFTAADFTFTSGRGDSGSGDTGSGGSGSEPAWSSYQFGTPAESAAMTKWLKAGATGSLTGTDGNDQLAGRSNDVADTLIGGKGDDTYIVGLTADQVVEKAGEGIDTVLSYAPVYTLSDNVENLIMSTGASAGIGNGLANRIAGNAAANVIDGKGGGDYLTGGGGADTFIIGKGYGLSTITDFKDAASAGSVVNLQGFAFASFAELAANLHQKGADVVLDLGSGEGILFKNATVAQFTAADFTFSAAGDNGAYGWLNYQFGTPAETGASTKTLTAAATGSLTGTDGNDQLTGRSTLPADTLIGGKGDDTYIVGQSTDQVVENANEGIDTVLSSASTHTLAGNVENLTLTAGAFAGIGNGLANRIAGNAAANVIDGKGGGDYLTGGGGADTFIIGKGYGLSTITDFKDAASAGSVVNLQGFAFASFAELAANLHQKGADVVLDLGNGEGILFKNATVAQFTAADFTFSAAGDTSAYGWLNYQFGTPAETGAMTKWLKAGATGSLTGTDGNDQLAGRSNDIADTLIGGKGDDTYIVGMTADQVVEKAGEGIDTVLSYAPVYTLSDNVENMVMSTGASVGVGNGLANRIAGNDQANVIDGKGGGDYLTGGGGADTFVIGKGYGLSTITDFKDIASAGSHVDLQGYGFTSFSQLSANLHQKDGDVVLDLGNGDGILFKNATVSQFTAADFTFSAGSDTATNYAWMNYQFGTPAESAAMTKWLKAGATGSLTGTDGNDQLAGRSNDVADTLIGGKGDDTYIVGMTADQVVEKAGEGIDTVLSYAKTYTLSDNVENLIMSTNAVTGIGNSLANRITGNDQANVIDGKGGGDYLTGGGGADTFIIGKGYGLSTITDFKATASAGSHVDLKGYTVSSFGDLQSHLFQKGSDVVLDLGSGDGVLFKNATVSQFTAADFTVDGSTLTTLADLATQTQHA